MTMSTQGLLDWMPRQRWFGNKTQQPEDAEIVDVVILDDGPPALALALVRVTFAAAQPAIYHVPVLLEEDGTARDALDDPWRFRLLAELMAHGHTIKGDHGAIEFGGPGLDPMAPPPDEVTAISGEQSNSSLVLGGRRS